MQVDTLGRPATGPASTPSWQTVQSISLPMCTSCGKSNGCSAMGRRPKKSFTAAATVGRAVVNTPVDWPGSTGSTESLAGEAGANRLQPTLPANAARHTATIPTKRT